MRPLRSLLVKLHPYVSCCASCGEIKTPLQGRLCTSLKPAFPVDAVLFGPPPDAAAAVRHALPWLRRVHGRDAVPAARAGLADLAGLADDPGLAENFFFAFPHSRLERIGMILDLFTPNGMPLCVLRPAPELSSAEAAWCDFLDGRGLVSGKKALFDTDIVPMTKECLKGFASLYGEFPVGEEKRPDVFAALARWCYASAMAVPTGPLHPLSARNAP